MAWRDWFVQIDAEESTKTITTFGCFVLVSIIIWVCLLPWLWMCVYDGFGE
jgi:hypothetical protein